MLDQAHPRDAQQSQEQDLLPVQRSSTSTTASPFFWPQRYTQLRHLALRDQRRVERLLRSLWTEESAT